MKIIEMCDEEIAETFRGPGFDVAVMGLGYVGCIVAAVLAGRGQRTVGVDQNAAIVEKVSAGKAPIYEPGLDELLRTGIASGRLRAVTDPAEAVRSASIVLITVGTPINRRRRVVLRYLDSAVETVASSLSPGSLVVVKSTVPPMTTEERIKPLLEKRSSLKAGREFGLAFVPERTVEGRAVQEFPSLTKIVGGIDPNSSRVAATFFRQLGGETIIVSKPRIAEAAKLFDNIYRDVNIALANELAILCEQIGVDAIEAIRAANYRYERTHLLMPGPGVGGSCLTKDPYIFLGASGPRRAKIIPAARQVNDGMPSHVVALVERSLKEAGRPLCRSKVAVLGYTFKANTDDTRNTPVRKIVELLRKRGADLAIYDPHLKELVDGAVDEIEKALEEAHCILIATDHDEFKAVALERFIDSAKGSIGVVDARHMVDPAEMAGKAIFHGVGRPRSAFS